MRIKKYKDFILEKMGVPSNIVESATNLFDVILNSFRDNSDYELEPDSGSNELRLDANLNVNIVINELQFDEVNFKISFVFNNNFTDIKTTHWGVMVPPSGQSEYAILFDYDSIRNMILQVNFLTPYTSTFGDLADYIESDRTKTIGVLSHELKHIYDKYKFGKEFISDIADYATFANVRTGFPPIDEFIYFIYVIAKAENLVRPAEIAGQLETLGIYKSEFKEFIESTSIYKDLIKIKRFKFQKLKDELMNDMPLIRQAFGNIPESETDDDVLNVVLNITTDSIIESQVEKIKDILDLENTIKIITGKIRQADVDYYKKYVNKRYFEKSEDFFLYWEKKLNFEAEKMLKKISKLFDMCKDDNLNPLMVKISKKDSIVDPKLYDEYVIKTKQIKQKYTK